MSRTARAIRTALRRRRHDEQGSLIVVLSIVLILVLLSSLLFVRIIGNNEIIRARQNTFSGVTGANAGLSDALFRIDQDEVGSNGVFCLSTDTSDTNCTVRAGASNPQLQGVEYVARTPAGEDPSVATKWVVQAIGQASTGFHGAVQETLTRSTKFKYAIFANKALTFTGNTTNNVDFATYTPGPSGTLTQCSNTTANPPCVYIGSNGAVSCSGPSPASVVGVYFNTGSGGGSDSCGTPSPQTTSNKVPVQEPPPGDWTCPNGGNLGSGYGYPTIKFGVWVCDNPINISGQLTVDQECAVPGCDPNVSLYVMTGTSAANFMTVAADSQINTDITYSSLSAGTGPPSGSDLPDSKLFQLYTDSSGNLTTNGTSDAFVWAGILYAPNAYLTANGCKSYFFGSVTINTYTCHGGPNLAFYYDTSLNNYYGDWQVSAYQQINPSSVDIP